MGKDLGSLMVLRERSFFNRDGYNLALEQCANQNVKRHSTGQIRCLISRSCSKVGRRIAFHPRIGTRDLLVSRYLRTYLIVVAVLIVACILGLWAITAFELSPQLRMLILLGAAIGIAGFTRLFWIGRRDGE